MLEEFVPVMVVGIFVYAAITIIQTISNNRLRQRLIDSGKVDEQVKYLFSGVAKGASEPLSSVKWGLVLIAVGLALFIGQTFFAYDQEEITLGMMFLFAGIAFMIYYAIARKHSPENLN